MENSKKIIVCLFFLISILFCKNDGQECATKETSLGSGENSIAEEPYKSIGNSLYQSGNRICLRVKNARLMHPSQMNKSHTDSICLENVFINDKNRKVALVDVVDTSTFEMVNASGTYYMDAGMIYVYSLVPHPVQFIAYKRNKDRQKNLWVPSGKGSAPSL